MTATLPDLTARVRAFVAERDWDRYHSPRNLAMALSVEAGELLERFLWTRDDDALSPVRKAEVADEAADVLMCLLNFCDRAGIDLEQALVHKLAKAAGKYPASVVRGQALKYDQYPTWTARHRLAAAPPELPPDDARFLVEEGVPVELVRDGRPLFRSEIGDGALLDGILGSDEAGVFVARADGVVFVGPDRVARRAGTSVRAFVRAIEAFHRTGSPADAAGPDPEAVADPDGYWVGRYRSG